MLLSGEDDIEVVAETSNGLEATKRTIAADASARILILTTFDLDEHVYEALAAGGSGFVLKDDPLEQLHAAIRTVAAHILQKLNLLDRVQAVVLAYQAGLFEPDRARSSSQDDSRTT